MELPKVIDLFCGCGGMAYGFEKAGFDIRYSVDIESAAIETFSVNFQGANHKKINKPVQEARHEFQHMSKQPNIVIGGPPCQAYSRAGYSKLRSLKSTPEEVDVRGNLYLEYFDIIKGLQPKVVLMENVPAAIAWRPTEAKGDIVNVMDDMASKLTKIGYRVRWTILNAADYGVPQARERAFLLAFHKSTGLSDSDVSFPSQTHRESEKYEVPFSPSFSRTRLMNKKQNRFYIPPPILSDEERIRLPIWVSAKDALGYLPSFVNNDDVCMNSNRPEWFESSHVIKDMTIARNYMRDKPVNAFDAKMRDKRGDLFLKDVSLNDIRRRDINTFTKSVTALCFRGTEFNIVRDYPIFSKMLPGHNYLNALQIATQRFDERIRKEGLVEGTQAYEDAKKECIPPYRDDAYEGKWSRIRPNKPSRTVVAHLGTDTYSHIHPWEPRGISVREAARLQSFPDTFVFGKTSMGPAFTQIGNAVPPLLSGHLALHIKKLLQKHSKS